MALCRLRRPDRSSINALLLFSLQKAGTARPSVVATLIEDALGEGQLTAQHEDDIKGVAGAILAGASLGLTQISLAANAHCI